MEFRRILLICVSLFAFIDTKQRLRSGISNESDKGSPLKKLFLNTTPNTLHNLLDIVNNSTTT